MVTSQLAVTRSTSMAICCFLISHSPVCANVDLWVLSPLPDTRTKPTSVARAGPSRESKHSPSAHGPPRALVSV